MNPEVRGREKVLQELAQNRYTCDMLRQAGAEFNAGKRGCVVWPSFAGAAPEVRQQYLEQAQAELDAYLAGEQSEPPRLENPFDV